MSNFEEHTFSINVCESSHQLKGKKTLKITLYVGEFRHRCLRREKTEVFLVSADVIIIIL